MCVSLHGGVFLAGWPALVCVVEGSVCLGGGVVTEWALVWPCV